MHSVLSLLVLALCGLAWGDMYLHNARGSNNRLDEATRNRNNANRLFDSQNNDRGGYNVGSLYYYAGSILPLEWTNQHSCGDPNNHCNIVFQYMCDSRLRDGATTRTIPDNPALCDDYDCNSDIEFGMHEDYDYYVNCKLRQRNMGLFTADQNLTGDSAIYTRQNPNGNRYGYECPEERDYYPYWHPTPWIDIAVLTNDASRCAYYQQESENVKGRGACTIPQGLFTQNVRGRRGVIPNNREECEELTYTSGEEVQRGRWVEYPPHSDASAPACHEAPWSRDNHLGNGILNPGYPNYFNWTIPDIDQSHCVIRARYNISTADYYAWDGVVNSSNNRPRGQSFAELDVWTALGLSREEAVKRGYVFENNPEVEIFPSTLDGVSIADKLQLKLRLAINTAQFGRTFQDRSHSMAIREKPSEPDCGRILNLNVRGKRGNIVQVYPGVEYDFVPNTLVLGKDDCVHIQWTGSNTNPNNNDGQGRAGTDRSNMVQLHEQNYPEGTPSANTFGHWGNSYPAHLNDSSLLGFTRALLQTLATLDNTQFGGEMSELDDAGTYFDLGLQKVTSPGTYYYMCSRNNNFSNRSQKGKLIALAQAIAQGLFGSAGGEVALSDASCRASVDAGSLDGQQTITLRQWSPEEARSGMNLNVPTGAVSNPCEMVVEGEGRGTIKVSLKDDSSVGSGASTMYRASRAGGDFVALETSYEDGYVVATTSEGGVFVATSPGLGLLIGFIVLALIIVLILSAVITGYCIYRRRTVKSKYVGCLSCKNKIKRSFQNKV